MISDKTQWLQDNFPSEVQNVTRKSKYYKDNDLWWFTLPLEYADREEGYLNLLLVRKEKDDYYFLKIPFSFFCENKHKLDKRKDKKTGKDIFDLGLVASINKFLMCKRSNLSFRQFLQTKEQ